MAVLKDIFFCILVLAGAVALIAPADYLSLFDGLYAEVMADVARGNSM